MGEFLHSYHRAHGCRKGIIRNMGSIWLNHVYTEIIRNSKANLIIWKLLVAPWLSLARHLRYHYYIITHHLIRNMTTHSSKPLPPNPPNSKKHGYRSSNMENHGNILTKLICKVVLLPAIKSSPGDCSVVNPRAIPQGPLGTRHGRLAVPILRAPNALTWLAPWGI